MAAKGRPEVVNSVKEEEEEREVEKEMQTYEEELSSIEEIDMEREEERPVTQHTMTAYVSSSEEARSINEQMNSHRRTFSADEESLTVPRIYIGGSRDGDSSTSRATEEDYHEIGYAR